jgi:hypothetical protein
MPLSDAQIERYSRQIIVPGVGGLGQERLIASRLLMIAEAADLELPLAYLVGAGVGTIDVHVPGDRSPIAAMVSRMRDLNSDVLVGRAAPDAFSAADLILVLAASDAAVQAAASLCDRRRTGWLIMARLEAPAKIAILSARPPCPKCADADLLAPFGSRSEDSGFVTMVATAEALNLLAKRGQAANASLIQFDGYQTKTRPARSVPGRRGCACPLQ